MSDTKLGKMTMTMMVMMMIIIMIKMLIKMVVVAVVVIAANERFNKRTCGGEDNGDVYLGYDNQRRLAFAVSENIELVRRACGWSCM
jgi:hypothetical protein